MLDKGQINELRGVQVGFYTHIIHPIMDQFNEKNPTKTGRIYYFCNFRFFSNKKNSQIDHWVWP